MVVLRRIALLAAAAASFAATSDAAVTPRFSFELAGDKATWVQSAEGGHAVRAVVENPGADRIVRKQLGVRYEDISVAFGANMSPGVAAWIQSAVNAPFKAQRKSGAIVASSERHPLTRLAFTDAVVTELGMPALDVASTAPASLLVKIAPWKTSAVDATKEPASVPAPVAGLSSSRFKLVIDGLPDASAHALRIEALTLKQKVVDNPTGEKRDYEKEPANVETPNLVVTFAMAHAGELAKWHQSFVIQGKNDQGQEKTGTLQYLSEDGSRALFQLDFHGLGIFKLTPDKVEAGSENIRRVKAEMYCEQMTFRVHPPYAQ